MILINSFAHGGIPAAPSGLVKVSSTDTTMTVGWTDNSNNEANFELSWGTDGIDFSLGSTSPLANATSAAIPGLAGDTVYYFRIRAVNAFGNSSYATSAALTTAPQAPSALTIGLTDSSSVGMSWTDNSTVETGFQVYRNGVLIDTTAVDDTNYTDTGLTGSTSYDYYIKATGANGTSDASNQETGTTT